MAIYQATRLSPANTAIDGTLANLFSFICNGSSITKYNVKAYRNSDNVQVYTTGDVVLSPVKYNKDKVEFTVPINTFTNGVEYKWDVTTYEGTSFATSYQVLFKANATATLTSTTPSSITTQSYTFNFVYTQAQNIPIEYWYMEFYDNSNVLLLKTDNAYNGNVSYKYRGFVSGNNYYVKATVVSSNGATVTSPIYNFSVSYAKPNINIIPSVVQDKFTSIVSLIWGSVVQIAGSVIGSFGFVQNYAIANNYALDIINSGDYYSADINIPQVSTTIVPIAPYSFSDGILVRQSGVDGDYIVGYDGTRFYFNNKGVMGYSVPITLTGDEYIVFLRPTDAYVKMGTNIYRLSVE